MKRQTIYTGRLERLDVGATVDGINEGEPATVSDQLTTRDEQTLRSVFVYALRNISPVLYPGTIARMEALAKRLGVEVEA